MAKRETNPAFRRILEILVKEELVHYRFWSGLAQEKSFHVGAATRLFYRLMRRLFGLTFTVKLLEGRERETARAYRKFLAGLSEPALKQEVEKIIADESLHERELIGQIQEQRVRFVSSIVLGINDGLIELTGALVGFTFAFRQAPLVAVTGAITGIAAALSMAASAYMQARHEQGKDARRAALYTGLSYISVVVLLVGPFFFAPGPWTALGAMLAAALLVIVLASFYIAVVFERDFTRQMGEMLVFSLGVAAVTFAISALLRPLGGRVLGP